MAYKDGSPVMMSDVANVFNGVENSELAAWENQTPAIIVNIQQQSNANTIKLVDSVKAPLPQLETSLPASIKVDVLTDRTITIRASVDDVEFELMLTIALVVTVIFLFLRSWRPTIIPSVAVPPVAGWHLRGDVCARLQFEQPHADGADHLDGLRG